MGPTEEIGSDSENGEEEHILRLMALLHELVRREGGRRGAARALGIDRRTVGACMGGGGLTWRLREDLERAIREARARPPTGTVIATIPSREG